MKFDTKDTAGGVGAFLKLVEGWSLKHRTLQGRRGVEVVNRVIYKSSTWRVSQVGGRLKFETEDIAGGVGEVVSDHLQCVCPFQPTETAEKTWTPTKADLEADAKEKN